MTLMDDIRRVYYIKAKCENCGNFSDVKIKKGISVEDYFKSPEGVCPNCGVVALKRFTSSEKQAETHTEKIVREAAETITGKQVEIKGKEPARIKRIRW